MKQFQPSSPETYDCNRNWAEFERWCPTVNQRLNDLEQGIHALLLAAATTKKPRPVVVVKDQAGSNNVRPIR